MGKLKKVLFLLGGVVAVLSAALLFFLPFPKTVKGSAEEFVLQWVDGTFDAESSVSGITILDVTREKILFERDGKRGICDTGAEFRRAVDVFEGEDAYSAFTFRLGECSKLERLALLERYEGVCFYATEPLAFDGTALAPTSRTKFDTIVLLQGTLPESFLEESGAEEVIYRNAETH